MQVSRSHLVWKHRNERMRKDDVEKVRVGSKKLKNKTHGLSFVSISMRLNSGRSDGKTSLFTMRYDDNCGCRAKKEKIDLMFFWEGEAPKAGDQCVV